MADLKFRRFGLPVMAFLAPVMLYLGVMLAAQVIPFGDNTLLLWDANYQNTAFMAFWKRVLAGQADGLYSFGRTLGGSMIGMIAFYLASPLNLLLLLPLSFPLLYSLLALLKIGLCGLTFMVFLRRRAWSSLLFSTAYALSGFMAAYCFRLAWVDAMVLLPLVALGIRHIHEGKKPFLYILALGLSLSSQYYFGYMLCLFALLYFLYHLHQWQWKTICRFALASLLAGGLAAVMLVPVYLTLENGYPLFGNRLLSLDPVNTLQTLWSKVYTASISTVQLRGNAPNYYVGIPVLAFVALYFGNSKISLSRRLRSLLFIALFAVSFWIAAPYYIWQAFDAPNFYPARFSFLFSFVLAELGAESLQAMQRPNKWLLALLPVAFAGITIWQFFPLAVEYLASKTLLFDMAVCALTCLLLLALQRYPKTVLWLILLMQFSGLFINSYYAYRRLSAVYTATASTYTEEVETTQAMVSRIQEADNSLFRMEKDFRRNDNDPLLYGYRGVSHMSSDLDQTFMDFCKAVGLHQGNYHLAYRSGTTPVLDSLFGVKYLLRKQGVAFAPLPGGYEPLWTDGDVTAYENTYALPFAYLVPKQTLSLTDDNRFVNQNTLLSDLTGETVSVFAPVYDIARAFDGTWETYTFPVEANRQLYLYSFGTEYLLNGTEETDSRMNGTILLPEAVEDTTYTLCMTDPLGIHLAYFDLEAFQRAQAILAAHAAQAESDTDSHLVITADVTDDFSQLLITLPYDKGWQAWVDGEKAETTSRYGALLAVDLTEGTHTVELRFVPSGLRAGAAVSAISLILLIAWMMVWKRRKG